MRLFDFSTDHFCKYVVSAVDLSDSNAKRGFIVAVPAIIAAAGVIISKKESNQ